MKIHISYALIELLLVVATIAILVAIVVHP